jgi:hypothetical protein
VKIIFGAQLSVLQKRSDGGAEDNPGFGNATTKEENL